MRHLSPDPQPWQPPLGWWGHAWRTVLVLLVSLLAWSVAASQQLDRGAGWVVLDVVVGVAALVAVQWRRRAPFAVAVLVNLVTVVSGTAAGPAVLATVSAATHRKRGQLVALAVLSFASGTIWSVTYPDPRDLQPVWLDALLNAIVSVAVVVWGMYVGSRRELLWTLRERAERAESEQALRVQQARATERQRIAREMHDVLGHRISLVSMHAGALSFRRDLDRDQVAESAQVILDNANLAMSDLRSVLGVLRGDDGEVDMLAADRPQPTLRDLPELVEAARGSGTRVTLDLDVDDPSAVPDALGRTAYRVVQEGLTNVRKHAPGAPATVTVRGDPTAGLRIRVANPLPAGALRGTTRPGYGMVGLAERAELRGGTLTHAVDDDRFTLEVWLPWAT